MEEQIKELTFEDMWIKYKKKRLEQFEKKRNRCVCN